MKINLNRALLALALPLTGFGVSACESTEQLDVKTFKVSHLADYEVASLISPYVYEDREGAAGTFSPSEGAVTVRETKDNLAKIERVLAEYDRGRADVRLHFQIIEADGFTSVDERIAAVEVELRKIFQFRGYRLAGEGFVSVTDGGQIGQVIQGTDKVYEITGNVSWAGPNAIRLEEVSMFSRDQGAGLSTTMNIRPGQTLVLGSSPKAGSSATLLVTVRAEEVPATNQ